MKLIYSLCSFPVVACYLTRLKKKNIVAITLAHLALALVEQAVFGFKMRVARAEKYYR